eukprot:TRINITY_DN6265_c0_g1_i7.p1 TRINITY_DN6265_c0_g1~~TRINITY_DN6265_c0_g1_i7.p1  ORF type:complete len:107 (+),score=28.11 TRINITY_DN6265_c0_g1_i7:40-321(+)
MGNTSLNESVKKVLYEIKAIKLDSLREETRERKTLIGKLYVHYLTKYLQTKSWQDVFPSRGPAKKYDFRDFYNIEVLPLARLRTEVNQLTENA